MASGLTSRKRKRVVLTIEDKVDIIHMIEQSSPLTTLVIRTFDLSEHPSKRGFG